MEISLAAAKLTNQNVQPLFAHSLLTDDLLCHEDEIVGEGPMAGVVATKLATLAAAKVAGIKAKPTTASDKNKAAAFAVASASARGPLAKIQAAQTVFDIYGWNLRSKLGTAGIAVVGVGLIGLYAYKTGRLNSLLGIEDIEAIKAELMGKAVNYNGQRISFGNDLQKAPHSPFKFGKLISKEGFEVDVKKWDDIMSEGKTIVVLAKSQVSNTAFKNLPEPVVKSVDVWQVAGSNPGCVMVPCTKDNQPMEAIVYDDSQDKSLNNENLLQRAKATIDGAAGKPYWSIVQAHACLKKANPSERRTTVAVIPENVIQNKNFKEVALMAGHLMRLKELGLTDKVMFTNQPGSGIEDLMNLVAPSNTQSDYSKALDELTNTVIA